MIYIKLKIIYVMKKVRNVFKIFPLLEPILYITRLFVFIIFKFVSKTRSPKVDRFKTFFPWKSKQILLFPFVSL